MKVIIKRVYNSNKKETGAILTAGISRPTNALEKSNIENKLIEYTFNQLYPNEGLNIYSEINYDTPSIVVIRKINDLPYDKIEI